MRFDRESWRKLYVAESMQHRAMPLFARGLRDYLIRFAEVDGTLLHDTTEPVADLARVLGANGNERKALADSLDRLMRIGYLSLKQGRLFITKFAEAQTAQSAGAKRQAAYLLKRKSGVTSDAPSDVTDDVSTLSQVTSHPTRRDEIPDADASDAREAAASRKPTCLADALAVPINERAIIAERDPHLADYLQPQDWPEIRAVAGPLGAGTLASYSRDSGVRAAVSLYAAGFSQAELERAVAALPSDPWWREKRRGLSALSAEVVRRALGPDPSEQGTTWPE